MENDSLKSLTQRGLNLFSKLAKAYSYNGIDFVMTDVVPQRGRILSEVVDNGGRAYMAGGKDGQQFFKNVPQYTLPYDTFCTREADTVGDIVRCLPKDICSDKLALFLYLPLGDRLWSKTLYEHTGSQIVATNEQNLRTYFEEKNNLADILRTAGLGAHVIPSEIIRDKKPLSSEQAEDLYATYCNEDGKVVVQYCGENCAEKGGGYSTRILTNLEEFKEVCGEQRDSYMKVAKFISGCNSNLSICAGNLVPSQDMLGAVKNNLLPSEDPYSVSTLYSLLHRARSMGINEDNVVVGVQPGTLKVVGAPQLTSISTNGVGNQLNYKYDDNTLAQIFEIGDKLGTLMAMCGKVGLCGADLIITKEGEVYVNEINDRQQGPTESAGLNNEANGLPALHRTSFLMNFADLKNAEVSSYLREVSDRREEIYTEATNIPSPFYIKFISKFNSVAKHDIVAGNYELSLNENGNWQWNLDNPKPEQSVVVDLTTGKTEVDINTVSAKEGDFFPKETQLLRINGVSTPDSMPFTVNSEGRSVLSPVWEAPISALYAQTLDHAQVNQTSTQEDDTMAEEETPALSEEPLPNESENLAESPNATLSEDKMEAVARYASLLQQIAKNSAVAEDNAQ